MVAKALEQVGLTALADRSYLSLTGGEKQRVRYQLELLELVRDLDLAVIMAMHDLNLAATYCDRIHVSASTR